MRIGYLLPKKDFFERGPRGSVAHAQGVATGLVEAGFDVHVFGGSSIKDYMPDYVTTESSSRRAFFSAFLFWRLHRSKFDIVIVRHATSCSLLMLFFCIFCNLRGTTVVLEVNSLGFHNLKQKNLVAAKIVNFFEVRLISRASCFYSVSDAMTNFLKLHIRGARVFTVPNGASTDEWDVGCIGEKEGRFVYLGSQQPYYDFQQLFNGFLQFAANKPEVKLIVYGKERADLIAQYGGYSQIEFRGMYSASSVQNELSRYDTLVLPRKFDWDVATSGGLSTKIFDYMSSGLLCIFPSTPELSDDLVDCENCLVYSDSEGLDRAFRMSQICDRRAMGAALRKVFLRSFTWESRMRHLMGEVKQLIDDKASE